MKKSVLTVQPAKQSASQCVPGCWSAGLQPALRGPHGFRAHLHPKPAASRRSVDSVPHRPVNLGMHHVHPTLRSLFLVAVLFSSLGSVCSTLRAAEAGDEARQIAVLQGDASPAQKDAACARLKRIGAAPSVPRSRRCSQTSNSPLGPLCARIHAGSGSRPGARGRVDQTSGLLKAGLVHSLGERHEASAVPALAKLLGDSDAVVASPAAVALGKIGGPGAAQALQAALPGDSDAKHAALGMACSAVPADSSSQATAPEHPPSSSDFTTRRRRTPSAPRPTQA